MTPELHTTVALSTLTALLLSWLLVRYLRTMAPRCGFVDVPNQRSSHQVPTPRAGGLGFVIVSPLAAAIAGRWLALPLPQWVIPLAAGSAIVAVTGLADDRWGLPVRVRLGAYVAASLLLLAGGGYLDRLEWPDNSSPIPGWIGLPLALLWIVGLTNAYNFMDGIDGIAAVQAVVAAGTVSALALGSGDAGLAIYTGTLAGGVLGFLAHNWPPARIFMGDVGSAFLGYTFAGLALISATSRGGSPLFVAWLILLAPFLFDSSFTLASRIVRGERWYEPHRQHLYQRLVRNGWPHLAVTMLYLSADLFLAAVIVVYFNRGIGLVVAALLTMGPLLGILALVKVVDREGRSAHADP